MLQDIPKLLDPGPATTLTPNRVIAYGRETVEMALNAVETSENVEMALNAVGKSESACIATPLSKSKELRYTRAASLRAASTWRVLRYTRAALLRAASTWRVSL